MVVNVQYPTELVYGYYLDMWVPGSSPVQVRIIDNTIELIGDVPIKPTFVVCIKIGANNRFCVPFVASNKDRLCVDLYLYEKTSEDSTDYCTRRRSSVTFNLNTGGVSPFLRLYEIPLTERNERFVLDKSNLRMLFSNDVVPTYGSISLDVPMAFHADVYSSEQVQFPGLYVDTRHEYLDWVHARAKQIADTRRYTHLGAGMSEDVSDRIMCHVRTLLREPLWYPSRLSFHVPGPMALHAPIRTVGDMSWWRKQLDTVRQRRDGMTDFQAMVLAVKGWAASRPYVRDWRITEDGHYELSDMFSHVQLQSANDCEDFALYSYYAWYDASVHFKPLRNYVAFLGYGITKNMDTEVTSTANHCMAIMVRKDVVAKWLGEPTTPQDEFPPFIIEDATLQDDGIVVSGDGKDAFAMHIRKSRELAETPAERRLAHGMKSRVHESDECLHHYAVINWVTNLSHSRSGADAVTTFTLDHVTQPRSGITFAELSKPGAWMDWRLRAIDTVQTATFRNALSCERVIPAFSAEDNAQKQAFSQKCRAMMPMCTDSQGSLHNVFIRAPLLCAPSLHWTWADNPLPELVDFLHRKVLGGRVRNVSPDVGDFIRFQVEWTQSR